MSHVTLSILTVHLSVRAVEGIWLELSAPKLHISYQHHTLHGRPSECTDYEVKTSVVNLRSQHYQVCHQHVSGGQYYYFSSY